MADDDLHDKISNLEAQIDELVRVIESCRKVILVSKVAIAAGGICLLAFMFGAIRFDPMVMIGAIAAVIGGTVVFGSQRFFLRIGKSIFPCANHSAGRRTFAVLYLFTKTAYLFTSYSQQAAKAETHRLAQVQLHSSFP